jgi:hypothetical protein
VPLRQRTLTGPATTTDRATFADTVTRMNADYALATDVITAVDAVWSALMPRLDGVAAALDTARALARQLDDPTADGDRYDAELTELRQTVLTDPLSTWDTAASVVRLPRLDDVARDVDAWHAELAEAARLRDRFTERLAGLRGRLEQLAAAETAARDAEAATRAKIALTGLSTMDRATVLRERLTVVSTLRGGWRWLSIEVRQLERELASALDAAAGRLDAATTALAHRDELRGRLTAYRAKAVRLGHAEDAELDRHYRLAHDMLWSAPCDLAAADAAVAAYQRAVIALTSAVRTEPT